MMLLTVMVTTKAFSTSWYFMAVVRVGVASNDKYVVAAGDSPQGHGSDGHLQGLLNRV